MDSGASTTDASTALFLHLHGLLPAPTVPFTASAQPSTTPCELEKNFLVRYPEFSSLMSLDALLLSRIGPYELQTLLNAPTTVIGSFPPAPEHTASKKNTLTCVQQAVRHVYCISEYSLDNGHSTVIRTATATLGLEYLVALYCNTAGGNERYVLFSRTFLYDREYDYALKENRLLQRLNWLLALMERPLLTQHDLRLAESIGNSLSPVPAVPKGELELLQQLFGSYHPVGRKYRSAKQLPNRPGIWIQECDSTTLATEQMALAIALPIVRRTFSGNYFNSMPLRQVETYAIRAMEFAADSEIVNTSQPPDAHVFYWQYSGFAENLFVPELTATAELLGWLRALVYDTDNTLTQLATPLSSSATEQLAFMHKSVVRIVNLLAVEQLLEQQYGVKPGSMSTDAARRLQLTAHVVNYNDFDAKKLLALWLDVTALLMQLIKPMAITLQMVYAIVVRALIGNARPTRPCEWCVNNCCLHVRFVGSTHRIDRHLMLNATRGPMEPRMQLACQECASGQTAILDNSFIQSVAVVSKSSGSKTTWLPVPLALAEYCPAIDQTLHNRLSDLLCAYAGVSSDRLSITSIHQYLSVYLAKLHCAPTVIRYEAVRDQLQSNLLHPLLLAEVLRGLLAKDCQLLMRVPSTCIEYCFLALAMRTTGAHSIILHQQNPYNYSLVRFPADRFKWPVLLVQSDTWLEQNLRHIQEFCTVEDLLAGKRRSCSSQEFEELLRRSRHLICDDTSR